MPVVPPAPVSYQGYIDVLSERYLAGWIRNLNDPTERVAYEVSLSHTNEILARGRADAYVPGLRKIGVGDGEHGYRLRLSRRLSQEEQDHLIVRPVPGGSILERSGFLATRYRPIQHIIMDLVDNCNLRCPFCVYDYAKTHTTHVMTEATNSASAAGRLHS
jgi:sulfatase maturation enzyme AslB (radical SAM superfamily)